MGYKGFDTPQIRNLADNMNKLVPGASKLHGDIAGVLLEAQQHLNGKPATTSPLLEPLLGQIFPMFYSGLPAQLQGELSDSSASMRRRCDQLDGCQALESKGFTVDQAALFDDAAAPDQAKINDALKYFDDHIDDSGGFLWSNSAQGAGEVLNRLTSLTPAERDAFLNRLSPDQLKKLNGQLGEGSSWWGAGDSDGGVKAQWANLIIGSVGPDTLARLAGSLTNLDLKGPDLMKNAKNVTYQPVQGQLFGPNGVDIKQDLQQGGDGDCWFLSSLAAIAERDPGYFQNHIRENANGTYTVTFYAPAMPGAPSQPVDITVDNQLPCGPNGQPVYAQNPNGVMWVAVYEKAYAQFRGSYENINGGWGDVGLHDLTGTPTDRLDAGDMSLSDLDKRIKQGGAITSGTKSDGPEFMNNDQIVSGHEYSVERVDMNANPPTVTLLNPWGGNGVDPQTNKTIPQEITLTESEWHKYFDEVGVTNAGV